MAHLAPIELACGSGKLAKALQSRYSGSMEARRILILAALAALAACGRQADLKPAPGEPMPVKPLMARSTPTVEQLLRPPANARPVRVDELQKKSEPRHADPFDLPPPSGGNAPSLPAGSDPGAVTNNTSSATPGD
jgi:hypothetical protein